MPLVPHGILLSDSKARDRPGNAGAESERYRREADRGVLDHVVQHRCCLEFVVPARVGHQLRDLIWVIQLGSRPIRRRREGACSIDGAHIGEATRIEHSSMPRWPTQPDGNERLRPPP